MNDKITSVEIDGSVRFSRGGGRYLVKVNEKPIWLTGKSFKYFTKLAWSKAYNGSGWIHKRDIEVGSNQARYIFRMRGEIRTELNVSRVIVENNRFGYYRLNVDPSKIRINFVNLKNHPDYELKILGVNK